MVIALQVILTAGAIAIALTAIGVLVHRLARGLRQAFRILEYLEGELSNNAGSTARDAIDRLERNVEAIAGAAGVAIERPPSGRRSDRRRDS